MTGFFVPRGNPPAAETDGPIGCAHLAAGLLRVGIPVPLVTDPLCLNAVKVAAQAAGISDQVSVDVVPVNAASVEDPSVASIVNAWQSAKPQVSHVIAIERAGPGYDGIVWNMIGKDITADTAPLHLLFTLNEIISIGIGYAGNELGMGTLPRELIAKGVSTGEKIACSWTFGKKCVKIVPNHYIAILLPENTLAIRETILSALPPCFEKWCQKFDDLFKTKGQKKGFRYYLAGLLGE
ncbi:MULTISPECIES: glutamate cyclase domain-containing protein, partial [unclassified Okeania]|uniref:glutamate cyclase domain-containing protein n=1 Tax=unclassified Okeania TaxID=2634635 RepID=UPI00257C3234